MELSLKPPALFDRRVDRRHHDELQWEGLNDWLQQEMPGPDVSKELLPHLGDPVKLPGYGYPEAYHWMLDSIDKNSAIALFDVPARVNLHTVESNFCDPYFDLPQHSDDWTPDAIEDVRMTVTCDMVPQDVYSPYPAIAKERSHRMMGLLKSVYERNEELYDNKLGVLFWGTHDNGQDYFVIESSSVFQPTAHAVSRGDMTFIHRTMGCMIDPDEKYGADVAHGMVLNPPPVYDSMHNLIHPNDYLEEVNHGDMVMVRTALCMLRQGGQRLYKHRLMEMHVMPSSRVE